MTDEQGMDAALAQARLALGTTRPNPAVGAVIVRDGVVIGAGYTQPPGGPHAEVSALADTRARGHDPRGATVYVTLEPCCHHGRTPPCTDALLAAGVRRVVVGVVDPFPLMQGKSLQLLEQGGVEVRLGVQADACADVMRGFLRTTRGGLPEVTLKVATSVDGHLATASGESQWITGEAARHHVHGLRARHDAVLVGIGTALADDPQLTARGVDGGQPVPVVLDAGLRLPDTARVLRGPQRAVVIAAEDASARALDAEVIRVPRAPAGVDLDAALRALAARGLHRILVEGGAAVHRSVLDGGFADRVIVYVAGTVIAGGRPWLGGPPLTRLADAPRWGAPQVTALGDDVALTYTLRPAEVR